MKARKTLLAAAIALTSIMANAVELEDYLVANSSYDDAFVSGSIIVTEPAGDAENEQVGYNYALDADYEKVFSTLPRSWGYTVALNATGNRPTTSTELITNPDFDNTLPTR